MTNFRWPSFTMFSLLMLLGACHKPRYPLCTNDKECSGHQEVCVNHHCQECRDDNQCEQKYPHEHRMCNEGRCLVSSSCETDQDCLGGGPHLRCRQHQCQAECQTSSDCPSPQRCVAQQCTGSCQEDNDCGNSAHCEAGECRSDAIDFSGKLSKCRPLAEHPNQWVHLSNVAFAFNRYDLDNNSRNQLESLAECIRALPKNVLVIVEGHCDDRGTQEYNLALGEKRAQAVLTFLRNLGVNDSRLNIRSKGENEPLCTEMTERCWTENRRVQFIQQKAGAMPDL